MLRCPMNGSAMLARRLALGVLLFIASGCTTLLVDTASDNPEQEKRGSPLGAYYVLPRGLITLSLVLDNATSAYVLTAETAKYVPDPDHYYRLDAAFSKFADDEITIQVSGDGFVSSISTKTKDQSVEIAKKLVELATVVEEQRALASPIGRTERIAAKFNLDANNLRVLAQRTLDLSINEERDEFQNAVRSQPGLAGATLEVLHADLSERSFSNQNWKEVAPRAWKDVPNGKSSSRCSASICFRPLIPYRISLLNQGATIARTMAILPNDAPLVPLEINRVRFVEATANYTFDEHGVLTKTDIKKPSEALGFITIPVDVAKAIIAIPAAVLDFKITNIQKETALAQQQKALLEAQQQLIDALRKANN